MPLYQYHCTTCEQESELLQPMHTTAAETLCPYCGGMVERLMSAFASQVVGSRPQPSAGGSCAPCTPASCGCH